MARQYELECGHCGYLFTIEGDTRTRSVKCEVCGGVLTVAIAIPVASDPPPAPPPPAPTPVPLPPPPLYRKRDPESLPPHRRAEYLSEPWWNIYRALKTANLATDIARYCTLLYMCFALFAVTLMPAADRRNIWQFHACVAMLFLLPAAIHSLNELTCGLTLAVHMGQFAIASLVARCLAGLLLVWYTSTQHPFALVMCGALLLMSFGFWLWFLRKLGQDLREENLVNLTRKFASQFYAGLVLALAFGVSAFFAMQVRFDVLTWGGQFGAGIIVLLVLWEYSRLLRAAALAIARRGPLDTDC